MRGASRTGRVVVVYATAINMLRGDRRRGLGQNGKDWRMKQARNAPGGEQGDQQELKRLAPFHRVLPFV